jgi:hypothetical protein
MMPFALLGHPSDQRPLDDYASMPAPHFKGTSLTQFTNGTNGAKSRNISVSISPISTGAGADKEERLLRLVVWPALQCRSMS